jgi:hypothetical protein
MIAIPPGVKRSKMTTLPARPRGAVRSVRYAAITDRTAPQRAGCGGFCPLLWENHAPA